MDSSDLIGIGRLGGLDDEGFFQFLLKAQYRDEFERAEEVYLIFNSDRVFFVTISERDTSDRKIRVKFAEDGIAEERKLHREAIIAIEGESGEEDSPAALIGYTVMFDGRAIGKICDYFHNNAQYVLAVETPEGREILIPWVDHFVSGIIPDPGVVLLQNAASLLAEG